MVNDPLVRDLATARALLDNLLLAHERSRNSPAASRWPPSIDHLLGLGASA